MFSCFVPRQFEILRSMKPSSILKSKWFLAAAILAGLFYFETKVSAQLKQRPTSVPIEASLR